MILLGRLLDGSRFQFHSSECECECECELGCVSKCEYTVTADSNIIHDGGSCRGRKMEGETSAGSFVDGAAILGMCQSIRWLLALRVALQPAPLLP